MKTAGVCAGQREQLRAELLKRDRWVAWPEGKEQGGKW